MALLEVWTWWHQTNANETVCKHLDWNFRMARLCKPGLVVKEWQTLWCKLVSFWPWHVTVPNAKVSLNDLHPISFSSSDARFMWKHPMLCNWKTFEARFQLTSLRFAKLRVYRFRWGNKGTTFQRSFQTDASMLSGWHWSHEWFPKVTCSNNMMTQCRKPPTCCIPFEKIFTAKIWKTSV